MPDADDVADLLASKRLLTVRPSHAFVIGRLKQATQNVDSSKLLAESNPRASVTIAYDAIRFAVDAHMQASGLRVANLPGAHRTSVAYSRSRMGALLEASDLDDYEALREVRNAIEYPEPGVRNTLSADDAKSIAAAADRVVIAVTSWWIERSAPQEPHAR
jgi:hypothetical protein